MDAENLADLYARTQRATHTLRAHAAEIFEMTQEIEHLTKDPPAWYASTRARAEARATLE